MKVNLEPVKACTGADPEGWGSEPPSPLPVLWLFVYEQFTVIVVELSGRSRGVSIGLQDFLATIKTYSYFEVSFNKNILLLQRLSSALGCSNVGLAENVLSTLQYIRLTAALQYEYIHQLGGLCNSAIEQSPTAILKS